LQVSGSAPTNSGVFFDAATRRRELEGSNPEIARPDFWQNPEAAQQLLAKRKCL